jgi:hypothetical protein
MKAPWNCMRTYCTQVPYRTIQQKGTLET